MHQRGEAVLKPQRTLPTNGDQLLRSVEEAMDGLEYGSILITVHAAKVVQLEVTKKSRFPA